ncbi:DNA sulfur modification protein DndB [Nostoc sp. NMS9]|uniref:DNA sulfur modification protein DndB n=1 Tax=Nostoc sp. NMS9 TaxID=2815393 RepID=UPI0025E59CB4|nr:DNA sulfur modification protein DndB [Nostoc sp. NMS9]
MREDDLDQIHQDFADCAKTRPIPPALLAAFDVSNILASLTRQLAKELVIFDGRIDKVSRTVGKDPSYLFTMNQLKVCTAEFLFGSSRKQVIESRSNQKKGETSLLLAKAKAFYMEFSKNSEAWKALLIPASATSNLDLYTLRQQRIDFNSVGFQIISKIGHLIFFGKKFTDEEQNKLISAVAHIDYTRESPLWQNNVVLSDESGNRKIVSQMAALEKAFNIVVKEVENQAGIKLIG